MEYIKSKDVFILIKDTLHLLAPEIIDHGYRVAYMVYKMLGLKKEYYDYEIADILFLVTLHDIGACQTDKGTPLFQFDTKRCMPHSIYGYLFCKNLTPLDSLARIVLYHHVEDANLTELSEKEKKLTGILKIADSADIYSRALGDKFDSSKFRKLSGTSLSQEGLELFYEAINKYDIINQVKGKKFQEELADYFEEYMIFSDQEKRQYLEMLMYCLGFQSYNYVVDTVTCLCICQALGEKIELLPEEIEILYYGALLHDVGMLCVPKQMKELENAPITDEKKAVAFSLEQAEKLMRNRVHKEVLDVILTPRVRESDSKSSIQPKEINLNKMQSILQVADAVIAFINQYSYKPETNKKEIIEFLSEKTNHKELNNQVVHFFQMYYDEIYEKVHKEEKNVISTYDGLIANYKRVYQRFSGEIPDND